MNTVYKLPGESRDYPFEYDNFPEIQNGDTVATAAVTYSPDDSSLTIGTATPNVAGNAMNCTISGGTAGTTYTLTCLATTAGESVLAVNGILNVVSVLPN